MFRLIIDVGFITSLNILIDNEDAEERDDSQDDYPGMRWINKFIVVYLCILLEIVSTYFSRKDCLRCSSNLLKNMLRDNFTENTSPFR